MSLRIFSALATAALVAACGPESGAPKGEEIDCAIGPGAEFAKVCTLEQVSEGQFVIHHPNGGFRRLGFDHETLEWRALDGADQAVKIEERTVGQTLDGQFEIDVSGDRYRITSEVTGGEN